MTINNPNIELVIAVLNGIDVDGESMQYILEKTGMIDQMKSQLGVATDELGTRILSPDVIDQIASDIADGLDNEGTDIIGSYELEMNNNYCEIDSIDLDTHCITRIIKDVLVEHFTPME